MRCNILLGNDIWLRVMDHPDGDVLIQFRQMSGNTEHGIIMISLPLRAYLSHRDNLNMLKELMINFRKALKEEYVNLYVKTHLGANIHTSIKSPFKSVHM